MDFTFHGVHSASLGCHYHPDAKERGDRSVDFSVKDLVDESRDGGYYIGARAEPRQFALSCYFEDITAEQQSDIYRWLRRDARGELIFDERPYAAYEVVVSKKPEVSLYDHVDSDGIKRYSGTFEANFTAYEPFAHMLENSYEVSCCDAALNETGILPTAIMPEMPSVGQRFFLLYNPGTEVAHTVIRMAGDVGDGLLIRNLTTAQRCVVNDLKASSLLDGACLELDSKMGQTRIVLGEESQLAFAMHDEGYITLAPCTPFVRSVLISHTEGSNVIASDGDFQRHMKGQYLFLNGWKKISQVMDTNAVIISQAAETSGNTITPIVTMNEIETQGDAAQLTRFEIDYVPRVE